MTPHYIDTLPIPPYAKNALESAGYITVEQLERESPKAISCLPKLGKRGFEAVRPHVPAWREKNV
jgi:hypothetical protein